MLGLAADNLKFPRVTHLLTAPGSTTLASPRIRPSRGQPLAILSRQLRLEPRQHDRLRIAPVRPGWNREDQTILAHRTRLGLTRKPIGRGIVTFLNTTLPENVNPLLAPAARPKSKRHKAD